MAVLDTKRQPTLHHIGQDSPVITKLPVYHLYIPELCDTGKHNPERWKWTNKDNLNENSQAITKEANT